MAMKEEQRVASVIGRSRDTSAVVLVARLAERHLAGYPGGQSNIERRLADNLRKANVPNSILTRLVDAVNDRYRPQIAPKMAVRDMTNWTPQHAITPQLTNAVLRMSSSPTVSGGTSGGTSIPSTTGKYYIRLAGVKSLRDADDVGWESGSDTEEPFIVWSCFGPNYERVGVTDEGAVKENEEHLFKTDATVFSEAPGSPVPAELPDGPLVFLYQLIERDPDGPSRDDYKALAAQAGAFAKAIAAEDWGTAITSGMEVLVDAYGIISALVGGGDDFYPIMTATFDHDRLRQITSGTTPGPLDQQLFNSAGDYNMYSVRVVDVEGGWKVCYTVMRRDVTLIGRISASPQQMDLMAGSQGTTMISWEVSGTSEGQVYVSNSKDGPPERLFVQGPSGSQQAPWIEAGVQYVFRLYAGTQHQVLLDEVTVSTAMGKISAFPQQMEIAAGSQRTTMISWTISGTSECQVYVSNSKDGGPERLFVQGPSGSQQAPWIEAGVQYVFRLYAGTQHQVLLDEITVTAPKGRLSASPRQLDLTAGSQGTTMISWEVSGTSEGQVYVSNSKDGGPERLFVQGPSGSQQAPWIEAGVQYVFRLYAGTKYQCLLDEVAVSTAKGTITASPQRLGLAPGVQGATTVSWETSGVPDGQIYVINSKDLTPERLFAQGPSGSQQAPWIETGIRYVFRLYAGTSHQTVLGEVAVEG